MSKLATEQLNEDLQHLTNSFESLKNATSQVAADTHTAVKTLKDKLQDTTYRFFSIIDAVNDIIIIKDGNGKWQTVNTRARELYGLTFDDYYNHTDEEIGISHPHHQEGLYNCIKTDEEAWNSKTYYRDIESFEVNGKTVYFDVIKTPRFNSDESRKELIVIGRDITELKEKEIQAKSLMSALNTSSDNIFIIDDKGKITFGNDMFLSLFNFGKLESALGTSFRELGLNQVYDSMFSVLETNRVWSDIVKVKKYGTEVTGLLTIVPMMNGKPKPIFYICTLKTY